MIAPRFETRRVGSARVEDWELQLRIVERVSEGGTFHVLVNGALGGGHRSLEDALAAAARDVPEASWRSDLAPRDGEVACPVCAAPVVVMERYPRRVCDACAHEAVDEAGHPVTFGNVDLSGGFVARRRDGSSPANPHACFIRGVACRADEARFGGVVIEVGVEARFA